MIKKYDIISLNNHLYMIENKEKRGSQCDAWIRMQNNKPSYLYHTDGTFNAEFGDPHVLASTEDCGNGLPLLPKVEEDIPRLDTTDEDQQWAFQQGYKAASLKKYSLEDMRDSFFTGVHSGMEESLDNEEEFGRLISFKSPKPIAVEIECIETCGGSRCSRHGYLHPDEPCDGGPLVPKTKDNIVIIKKWIYE